MKALHQNGLSGLVLTVVAALSALLLQAVLRSTAKLRHRARLQQALREASLSSSLSDLRVAIVRVLGWRAQGLGCRV